MTDDLRQHERLAIERLLAGDAAEAKILLQQLAVAVAVHRLESTVGFQVDFGLPEGTVLLSNRERLVLGNLKAEVRGVDGGIGFALFIEGGRLASLDGTAFGENWPGAGAHVFNYQPINANERSPLERVG